MNSTRMVKGNAENIQSKVNSLIVCYYIRLHRDKFRSKYHMPKRILKSERKAIHVCGEDYSKGLREIGCREGDLSLTDISSVSAYSDKQSDQFV